MSSGRLFLTYNLIPRSTALIVNSSITSFRVGSATPADENTAETMKAAVIIAGTLWVHPIFSSLGQADWNPTTGIGEGCVRAASGHTTVAPPSVGKNFRRSMWLAM